MAIGRVGTIDDRVRVATVLASVSDKTGLESLAKGLRAANRDLLILSTGGTFSALQALMGTDAWQCLRQVSAYTGQPEMQGGLVKTLDYRIYLGLLSETYNPAHQADLGRAGALPIDMVIANLYPFSETVARAGTTVEDARGNIDIGGPCMVRAAAKNFHRVAVVVDPADYAMVVQEMAGSGGTLGLDTRFRLAQKAFRHIAAYDASIAGYLSGCDVRTVRDAYTVRAGR